MSQGAQKAEVEEVENEERIGREEKSRKVMGRSQGGEGHDTAGDGRGIESREGREVVAARGSIMRSACL